MSYSEADYTMAKTYIQSKITRMYLDDSEMSSNVKQALLLLSVQIHALELPDIEEPGKVGRMKKETDTPTSFEGVKPIHFKLNLPKDFDDLSGEEY